MSDYTDDDLSLLTEHVDHLQRRVNRLLHAYGGNHDQKTHGRGKSGAGRKGPSKPGLFGRFKARRKTAKRENARTQKRALAHLRKKRNAKIAGTSRETRPGFLKRNRATIAGSVGGLALGGIGSVAGGAVGALIDARRAKKRGKRNAIRTRAAKK